ncbi:MAG: copper amine oxidase N-terminal domain-containing protein [Bacillota bacterium]|nr:copper amine oxidase N-terminal domain-containing protein [Bacillota bacterium]
MKKILLIITVFITTFTLSVSAAKIDNNEIKIAVNDGVTLVSASELAKLMDLDYKVDNSAYTLSDSGNSSNVSLTFTEGSKTVSVKSQDENGKVISNLEEELPVASKSMDGKLYVPLRYVCEAYGAKVRWTSEDGAVVERTSYKNPTLIKTDGNKREIVSMPEGFNKAEFTGNKMVYSDDKAIYTLDMETGKTEYVTSIGSWRVDGDYIYVIQQGSSFNSFNIKDKSEYKVAQNATQIGFTNDGNAWCVTKDGTYVKDVTGKTLATVTGDFNYAFEYADGYVYYLKANYELRRAHADGSGDEFLAKAAYYPEYIDGYIYYSDMAENFRRVNAQTKEDIMVYGLNLEFRCKTKDGRHILNFYTPVSNDMRMFICNSDGSDFKPFSDSGVVANSVTEYDGAYYINNAIDGCIYMVKDDKTVKLSQDKVSSFCGVYDGYAYYVVK